MTNTVTNNIIVLNDIHRGREAAEKLGLFNTAEAFGDIENAIAKIDSLADHKDILERAMTFLNEPAHRDSHGDEEKSIADLRAGVRIAFALDHIISDDLLEDSLFHTERSSDAILEIGNRFRTILRRLYDTEVTQLLNQEIKEDIVVDTDIDEAGFLDYTWPPPRLNVSPK